MPIMMPHRATKPCSSRRSHLDLLGMDISERNEVNNGTDDSHDLDDGPDISRLVVVDETRTVVGATECSIPTVNNNGKGLL